MCPSCNTQRMVETAAHLADNVFPRLLVRQWVLSVPKRLRFFLQRDGAVLNMVLRIFLRVIAHSLQTHSPGAAHADTDTVHIGAVAFIHRFGSSLNEHVHFHACVVDGVLEAVAGEEGACDRVIFHPATGIDPDAAAQAQARLRRRILRAFVGCGLLESFDAKEMLGYKHSGFSVDAGVCIQAHDRAGLERLLRYCARPPFSMDRLRKAGGELVYRCAKPLRAAVTAMAAVAQSVTAQAEPAAAVQDAPAQALPGKAVTPDTNLPRRAAHYLWAVLIARIYEVFPLLCPLCGGQMRIIAFITHTADIRHILDHIGVESEPPHITPARGPPLWDDCGAQEAGEGVEAEPDWDMAAQPPPDYCDDQRTT